MPSPNALATITLSESGTVAGNAATEILNESTRGLSSDAVMVHNSSSQYDLWLALGGAKDTVSTITISSTVRDFVLQPGQTLLLDIKSGITIWGKNSSGGATTSTYSAKAGSR